MLASGKLLAGGQTTALILQYLQVKYLPPLSNRGSRGNSEGKQIKYLKLSIFRPWPCTQSLTSLYLLAEDPCGAAFVDQRRPLHSHIYNILEIVGSNALYSLESD